MVTKWRTVDHKVDRSLVEAYLEIHLTMKKLIMLFIGWEEYTMEKSPVLSISMPRWRFDILHPIDLVEEVAIGHGYDDLSHDVPKAP